MLSTKAYFKGFAIESRCMRAPPLLLNFRTAQELLDTLSDDIRTVHAESIASLVEQRLPPAVSIRVLAILFGFSPKFVSSMVSRSERYYRIFRIPKGRGQRIIQAPKVALKAIQKWISFHLEEAIVFDDCVHGFVRGRSAMSAASVHCGARWVYTLDLQNFFQTTSKLKVKNALLAIGYQDHGAEIISKLCSYNGFLAQGSPASPVLSNLVFRDEDRAIKAIADSHYIKYTRYADDLVFSGDDNFPEAIKDSIKAILAANGWRVAEEKEHFSELPKRLKVHGFLVHHNQIRLTKGYRRKIRTYKNLLAHGQIENEDIAKIKGHISYATSVERFTQT